MKVAFHSNQLGLRGTEVALFDYAHFNEIILGNESIIVSPRSSPNHHLDAVAKFCSRFRVWLYDDPGLLDPFVEQQRIDVLYFIKAGFYDGLRIQRCRTAMHAVFKYNEPHGDVYAYISRWLSEHTSRGRHPYVPHMVHLPKPDRHLRAELGIPDEVVVFGRHGGRETFDIPFAREAVHECARRDPGRFFVFMNTDPFCESLPNIIHLPGTADPLQKARFIATCDAMLHARIQGESFGLAIGEFSLLNKPILTWDGSPERCHLEILGDKSLRYRDKPTLLSLLDNFQPDPSGQYDAYSRDYSPEAVMARFKEVFLKGQAERHSLPGVATARAL